MKINRYEFFSLIKQHVEKDVDLGEIKLDTRLVDIGIDSLAFATLLWDLEERFKIQIDDEYLETLNGLSTISDLVASFKALGHEIDVESSA